VILPNSPAQAVTYSRLPRTVGIFVILKASVNTTNTFKLKEGHYSFYEGVYRFLTALKSKQRLTEQKQ